MENRPSKSTPSVERMEIIDSTLTYDDIGELKAWADWATREPREFKVEGGEGKYQRAVEHFEHVKKYFGIPLHFETVDDMRHYFQWVVGCDRTDKIHNMKEYIVFLPFSLVQMQKTDVSERDMLLYRGLRALVADEFETQVPFDYCDDLVNLWSSDRYMTMASYCPFSVSNAIISIG